MRAQLLDMRSSAVQYECRRDSKLQALADIATRMGESSQPLTVIPLSLHSFFIFDIDSQVFCHVRQSCPPEIYQRYLRLGCTRSMMSLRKLRPPLLDGATAAPSVANNAHARYEVRFG